MIVATSVLELTGGAKGKKMIFVDFQSRLRKLEKIFNRLQSLDQNESTMNRRKAATKN